MNLLPHLLQGEEGVLMMPQPGLEVWTEPLVRGDHLKDLAKAHLLQGLRRLTNRHRAQKPVAIEDPIRLNENLA